MSLPRPLVTALLAYSLLSAAFASPVTPPIDLLDLPRDQLPLHDWWQDSAWTDPGNWKTVNAADHGLRPDDESVDAADILNRLFKETTGNTLVQLPAGTFTLRKPLSFSRDGLRLRGAGRDQTTLRFAAGIKDNAISIGGRQTADTGITVSPAPKAGDRVLTVNTPAKLAPGATVWLSQAEPKSFGQLARVTSVEADRVTLDRALSLDFDPAQPTAVSILTPRRDCAIEDLRIDRRADPRNSTINIAYGANILLRNLELVSTEFAHIYLWRAQEIFIEENIIHHSRHYGVGGSGYGVSFGAGTTRCLVRGNAMYYLRHATVLSGYAAFNVIADNYLRSDQGHLDERHHGTFPFATLYEGNDALGIYADARSDVNGPWNTHYRNRATRIDAGPRNVCAKPPYFVAANLVSNKADGTFAALNQVAGQLVPGALPATARLPVSLYRTREAASPTPLIGPDSPNFGAARTLPAEAWVPPIYRGGPESLVTINAASTVAGSANDLTSAAPTFAKLLPESLGPALSVTVAGRAGTPTSDSSSIGHSSLIVPPMAAAARVSPAGDKVHVLLENTASAPVRVRFAYPSLPAAFNAGVVRGVFWQAPISTVAPASDLAAWRTNADQFYTDFSPREGHVLVVDAHTVVTFELTNNTRRLSRY